MKLIACFRAGVTTKRMKIFVLFAVAVFASTVFADGSKTTYQTMPNSMIRDYRAPAYVTKGNTTYQTLPGSTIRDYRAPTYVTKGNTTYQTLPGSNIRDWRAPSYVTSKGKK